MIKKDVIFIKKYNVKKFFYGSKIPGFSESLFICLYYAIL